MKTNNQSTEGKDPQQTVSESSLDGAACSSRVGNCPLEQRMVRAFEAVGVEYRTDYEGRVPENLDFYLPKFDVHVEVKGGHSPRISKQVARSKNVIAVQGVKAVELLALLFETNYQGGPRSRGE